MKLSGDKGFLHVYLLTYRTAQRTSQPLPLPLPFITLCVKVWEGGSLSSHFKARYSVLSSLLSSNSC